MPEGDQEQLQPQCECTVDGRRCTRKAVVYDYLKGHLCEGCADEGSRDH
jgi:hypothetical protein